MLWLSSYNEYCECMCVHDKCVVEHIECCLGGVQHSRYIVRFIFFFSSRRRHTRLQGDWSSDVCSSDLELPRARLDQRHETFVPHVLAIMAGTVVDFPNSDSTYHNVFSLSKTQRFDLGRYPQGHFKSVRFDRPGVVRVFCDIHSHMSAFILVFSHPYFATTDTDGRYRIDNIPGGTY